MTGWLIIGGILYAWVFLTVMGTERQRQLQKMRDRVEAELARQPPADTPSVR